MHIVMTFFSCISSIYPLVLRHHDLSSIATISTSFITAIVCNYFYIFNFLSQLLSYIFFPHSCISSPFPSFLVSFIILFMFHVCRCLLLCFCFAIFLMQVPLCLQFSTTSCIFTKCNIIFFRFFSFFSFYVFFFSSLFLQCLLLMKHLGRSSVVKALHEEMFLKF